MDLRRAFFTCCRGSGHSQAVQSSASHLLDWRACPVGLARSCYEGGSPPPIASDHAGAAYNGMAALALVYRLECALRGDGFPVHVQLELGRDARHVVQYLGHLLQETSGIPSFFTSGCL